MMKEQEGFRFECNSDILWIKDLAYGEAVGVPIKLLQDIIDEVINGEDVSKQLPEVMP